MVSFMASNASKSSRCCAKYTSRVGKPSVVRTASLNHRPLLSVPGRCAASQPSINTASKLRQRVAARWVSKTGLSIVTSRKVCPSSCCASQCRHSVRLTRVVSTCSSRCQFCSACSNCMPASSIFSPCTMPRISRLALSAHSQPDSVSFFLCKTSAA